MLSRKIVLGPVIIITFLVFFTFISDSSALAPLGLQEISSILMTGIQDMKIKDNYGYAMVPQGLIILDVSDLSQPVKLKEIPLNYDFTWVAKLILKSNYLYEWVNYKDLLILDISDPLNPVQAGLADDIFTGGVHSLELFGDLILGRVEDGSYEADRVLLIDIADPVSPQVVLSIYKDGLVDATLNGNYLYLTSYYGGAIYDISDLSNPQQVGSLPSNVSDIVVEDTLAYVLTHSNTDSFEILNVKNISQIELVAGVPTSMSNNEAGPSLTKVAGLLVWPNNGLEIFDVQDPFNPISRGVYDTQLNSWGRPAVVSGTKIFMTGGALEILDLADASNPVCVSAGFGKGVNLVDINGKLAVVGEQLFGSSAHTRIYTLDISNSSAPYILGQVEVPGNIAPREEITSSGGYYYVLLPEQNAWQILNLSDPAHLEVGATRYHCGSPLKIAATENNLFVAGTGSYDLSPGCVNIYDLSDKAWPQIIYQLVAPVGGLSYTEVLIKDSLMYLGAGSVYLKPKAGSGIYVYNIKIPSNPELISYYPDLVPLDMDLHQDTLFCLGHYGDGFIGSLGVIDASDPTALKLIAETPYSLNCSPDCATVLYRDGFLFTSSRDYSLQIYDFTDRTTLHLLSDFSVNGKVISFQFTDELFAVANSNSLALYSYDFSQPRGDLNHDSEISLADIIYLVNYLFGRPGNWQPYPIDIADASCDGRVSLVDVIQLVNFIYKGVPLPC